MTKKTKNTSLTPDDWVEIYYALASKMNNIPPPLPVVADTKKGLELFRKEDARVTRNWRRHLERIMKKIGPDGRNMTKRG